MIDHHTNLHASVSQHCMVAIVTVTVEHRHNHGPKHSTDSTPVFDLASNTSPWYHAAPSARAWMPISPFSISHIDEHLPYVTIPSFLSPSCTKHTHPGDPAVQRRRGCTPDGLYILGRETQSVGPALLATIGRVCMVSSAKPGLSPRFMHEL